MSWNYRVVRFTKGDEKWVALHEVYYDDAGEVNGWTECPAFAVADDTKGLAWVLGEMSGALGKPVIDVNLEQEARDE